MLNGVYVETAQPLGTHNEPCPLVPTACLSYLVERDFEHYNPPQSDFIQQYTPKCNFVVAIPTSAGKTYTAEIAMAYMAQHGKRSLYMSPLKALAEEKAIDWTDPDHSFSKAGSKVGIMTGDYRSGNRDKVFSESDIILASYEIIDHFTKFTKRHELFGDIGCVVIDEGHNVADTGRGGNLEFALSRLTAPKDKRGVGVKGQIIFLSASVPNTDDVARWLTGLNGKETIVISSDYRPCQLHQRFLQISRTGSNYAEDGLRKQAVYSVIQRHAGKQGIIFVSNKAFGRSLVTWLKKEHDLVAKFHCADISLPERRAIETEFKNKELSVVVSTPTLAQGVNLPAHYVVVSDTRRGNTRVSPQEVQQCCGRAGRPKYDLEGHAYIILRNTEIQSEQERLAAGAVLTSSLSTPESFALHLLSDISCGLLRWKADIYTWYKRTFSHVQSRQAMSKEFCHSLLSLLYACKAIKTGRNELELAQLGRVAVNLYIHPVTIADWFRGFRSVERIDTGKDDICCDAQVCWALARAWCFCPANPAGVILPSVDNRYVNIIEQNIQDRNGEKSWQMRAAAALFQMLSGRYVGEDAFTVGVRKEFGRWTSALSMIQSFYATNDREKHGYPGWDYTQTELQVLSGRMIYGVSRKLIPLVGIRGVGTVLATKLYQSGIRRPSDFSDPEKAGKARIILGNKRYGTISMALSEDHGVNAVCEFRSVF